MTGFVELSEEPIVAGLGLCSVTFREAQRQFVLSCQHSDGGYVSPGGDADLYYTDFALRALAILDVPRETLLPAADWLSQRSCGGDEVTVFSYLNARRLLTAKGIAALPLPNALPQLNTQNAYRLFVGLLCRELVGKETPSDAAEAVLALTRDDGGFAVSADHAVSQTNATAAAVAVLVMSGRIDDDHVASALEYLAARQCPDGGFAAHGEMRSGDLLSTFTATLSLAMLGRIPSSAIDLAALARFVRGCSRSSGGFAAVPDSAFSPDVEYSYYGIGLTALLRGMLAHG